MKFITCTFAIDAPASALNNGEKSKVKSIYQNGRPVPYVSAQAVKYWLRQSMEQEYYLKSSPVTKVASGKNQGGKGGQAYTAGNPVLYYDDDLFGFMVALSGQESQRPAPFALSTIVGQKASIQQQFMTMSRAGHDRNGNPVATSFPIDPQPELYTALLVGSFSLDLGRVGVFAYSPGSRYKEISQVALADATPENGAHNDKANYLVTL